MSDIKKLRKELRRAVADYMYSEGCSCCRDSDAHEENEAKIAKLLNVRKYSDGTGYDFFKYRSQ